MVKAQKAAPLFFSSRSLTTLLSSAEGGPAALCGRRQPLRPDAHAGGGHAQGDHQPLAGHARHHGRARDLLRRLQLHPQLDVLAEAAAQPSGK